MPLKNQVIKEGSIQHEMKELAKEEEIIRLREKIK